MRRYIDAELLKADIRPFAEYDSNRRNKDWVRRFEIAIDNVPTADVRENVKAHWIDMKPTGDSRFMCSRCKGKENVPTIMGEPIVWDYCPNCGADMRGDER